MSFRFPARQRTWRFMGGPVRRDVLNCRAGARRSQGRADCLRPARPAGLVLILLLCLAPAAARAAVVHVAADGAGDGSSWAQARGDLAAALAAAAAGDQVWLAQGTWKPGSSRASTFSVPAGVALYGGFLGTENDPVQRPGTPGLTVLSGEIGGAGAADNCYHVVTLATGGSHHLDGLTISGGYADGGGSTGGGGIHAGLIGDLVVNDCRVLGNHAGSGGGLFLLQSGDLDLTGCRFEGNSADTGSAVYQADCGRLRWQRTLVVGNTFAINGNYHILASNCASFDLDRCVIAANTGLGWLGIGAPALQVMGTPLTLRTCLIAGNQSIGLSCDRALLLEGSTVAGNAVGQATFNNQLTTATTPPLPVITIRDSIVGAPYVLSVPPAADQRAWLADLQGDPGFLDPANPAGADGIWLTADDGFQLSATSAALGWARMAVPGADPALGALDLRGLARPQGREPEPGCYERAEAGGRAPVTLGQSVTVPEDTAQVLLTVGGGDADGDAVSARILALPALGTLWPTSDGITASGAQITTAPFIIPGGGRSVLYQPPADAFGSPLASFTAELDDGHLTSYPATLAVTVTAVNDPPILDPLLSFSVAEDSGQRTVLVTGIAASAAGNESQVITVSASSSDGTLVNNVAVTYTSPATFAWLAFAPMPDRFGTATITVTVEDEGGLRTSSSFDLTIAPVNDPPWFTVAANRTMPEDSTAVSDLALVVSGISPGPSEQGQGIIVNAYAIDQTRLRIASIDYSQLNSGVVTFWLAPQPDATGTSAVFVTATDSGGSAGGGSDNYTRQVLITLLPVNDPPLATVGSVTAAGIAAVGTAALSISDADLPSTASLVCTLAALPAHGDLLLDGAPLAVGGSFTQADLAGGTRLRYRSDPARPGASDAIVVTVSDGIAAPVGPVTVPVTILATVNQPPAVATTWLATAQDTARTATVVASDPDGDALAWAVAVPPRHGSLTVVDAAAGILAWTPAPGWSGTDQAGLTVHDGLNPPVAATIALVVTGGDEARPLPLSDPPHAVAPGEELRAPLSFTLRAESGALAFALVGGAPAGMAVAAGGPGSALLSWDVPESIPPGTVVRCGVLAVEGNGRAAAVLPLTLVVRPLLRGSN
ncbi:MAG: Ig-like domain-containing protein [Planctomycetes bacterium]|nr:Ig-like domain-containing protein [Planctomycetota bacterium]